MTEQYRDLFKDLIRIGQERKSYFVLGKRFSP